MFKLKKRGGFKLRPKFTQRFLHSPIVMKRPPITPLMELDDLADSELYCVTTYSRVRMASKVKVLEGYRLKLGWSSHELYMAEPYPDSIKRPDQSSGWFTLELPNGLETPVQVFPRQNRDSRYYKKSASQINQLLGWN